MDTLQDDHEIFCENGNLAKSLEDLQRIINLLAQARAAVASGRLNYILLHSPSLRLVSFSPA